MRSRLVLIAAFLLFTGLPITTQAEEPTALVWAFFLKDESEQVRSLTFDQPEGVVAGDLLRIYLQLQEETYVYLYLHDSHQDLYLVFPPGPDFYAAEFPAWRKFYIPSGRGWLTLDQGTGTERFYLLASNRRLIELEGLTDQFLMERDNRALHDKLLAAIKRQSEKMSETVSLEQTPVPASYNGGNPALNENPYGSMANLTRAVGDFSLIFDLVNR